MEIRNLKKIGKGICFLLIFLALFYPCQKLLQAKWTWKIDEVESATSTTTWNEYRALEKDSVQVLFLGTSHVYSGIDPMYIYEQTGVTSYVLGGPAMRMDLTYMSLEEGLKTQKPAVVLLDMSAVHYKKQLEEARCHKVSDQMPISRSKIEYAFDNDSKEMKPLDVLFPFFRYHSRWEQLGEEDFKYLMNDLDETFLRGHFISYKTQTAVFRFEEQHDYFFTERNYDYFKRIINLCRENDIALLLFKVPSPTWFRSRSEGVAALAEEEGLTYLEPYYDMEEMGLELDKHFRDEDEHLNQYGCEKFCDYLMQYLQEHYELTDQRAVNAQWNEDLEQYKLIKQSLLEKSLLAQ